MEPKQCDNCANLDHVTYQGDKEKSEACYVMAFHAVPKMRICDEWRPRYMKTDKLPIPTTGANINNLLDWLKKGLAEKQYGELGLIFTVHNGQVVKWQKTESTIDKNENAY